MNEFYGRGRGRFHGTRDAMFIPSRPIPGSGLVFGLADAKAGAARYRVPREGPVEAPPRKA